MEAYEPLPKHNLDKKISIELLPWIAILWFESTFRKIDDEGWPSLLCHTLTEALLLIRAIGEDRRLTRGSGALKWVETIFN